MLTGALQLQPDGVSFFFFFFFPQDIIDDYKRHVDWKSDDQPGGFEALNVRFIKEFVFLT